MMPNSRKGKDAQEASSHRQVAHQSGWELPYVPFIGLGIDARRALNRKFTSVIWAKVPDHKIRS